MFFNSVHHRHRFFSPPSDPPPNPPMSLFFIFLIRHPVVRAVIVNTVRAQTSRDPSTRFDLDVASHLLPRDAAQARTTASVVILLRRSTTPQSTFSFFLSLRSNRYSFRNPSTKRFVALWCPSFTLGNPFADSLSARPFDKTFSLPPWSVG